MTSEAKERISDTLDVNHRPKLNDKDHAEVSTEVQNENKPVYLSLTKRLLSLFPRVQVYFETTKNTLQYLAKKVVKHTLEREDMQKLPNSSIYFKEDIQELANARVKNLSINEVN